jgi:hypothetical protein
VEESRDLRMSADGDTVLRGCALRRPEMYGRS